MNDRNKIEKQRQRLNLARIPGRVMLIGMLVVAPWMLGAIAAWSQTLLCICGLLAIAFWWLEIAVLRPKHIVMPLSVIPIVLGVALGLLHFLPLPDSLATVLGAGPAYEQWERYTSPTAMDIEMVQQLALHTRDATNAVVPAPVKSISIDPNATRLMTAQLLLAAIAYMLGAHLFHDRRSLIWLCTFLAANGVVISLFGIVQKVSSPDNLIYGWIQVSSGGVFGPYVNRNNAAGLLVMCLAAAIMLTVSAFREESDTRRTHGHSYWYLLLRTIHELDAKKLLAIASVIFIIGGIVATLSRGGTLALLAGAVASFVVMGIYNRDSRSGSMIYLAVALLLGTALVGWMGFGDRIIERFEAADQTDIMDDMRIQNWRDTAALIPQQWVVGSGLSTYQHVHRAYRTSPETNLYYFAENQYFQALLDGGIIGLLLLLGMLAWSVYYLRFLLQAQRYAPTFMVALFGTFALTSQAVSSIFDFGLYMPANMMTFAVIMGSIAGVAQANATRLESHRRYAARLSFGRLGSLFLLLLFSGGLLALTQFYHRYQVESACLQARQVLNQDRQAPVEEIEQSLAQLQRMSQQHRDLEVQTTISELLIRRFRVQQFQQVVESQTSMSKELADQVWARTRPLASAIFLHQQIELNPELGRQRQETFRSNRQLRDALLPAYASLLKARAVNPLTAEVHLQLAEIGCVLVDIPTQPHLTRATSIAPTNPDYQLMAGTYLLRQIDFQTDVPDFEPAMDHLRSALELQPKLGSLMESLVVQKNIFGAWVYGLSPTTYARSLLLPYPEQLQRFASNHPYFTEHPEDREELFQQCLARFQGEENIRYWDYFRLVAMGKMAQHLRRWDYVYLYGGLASNKILPPNEGNNLKIDALIEMGKFSDAQSLLGEFEGGRKKELQSKLEIRQQAAADAESQQ